MTYNLKLTTYDLELCPDELGWLPDEITQSHVCKQGLCYRQKPEKNIKSRSSAGIMTDDY